MIKCQYCDFVCDTRRELVLHLKNYHKFSTKALAETTWPRPEKIRKVALKEEEKV